MGPLHRRERVKSVKREYAKKQKGQAGDVGPIERRKEGGRRATARPGEPPQTKQRVRSTPHHAMNQRCQPHTSKPSTSACCPQPFRCHFCASNTNLGLRNMDVFSQREKLRLSAHLLPTSESRDKCRGKPRSHGHVRRKPRHLAHICLCITGASLLSPQHTTRHMPALKMPTTYLSSPLPPFLPSFSH